MAKHSFIHIAHQTSLYFLEALAQHVSQKQGINAYVGGDFSPRLNTAVETGKRDGSYAQDIRAVELFFHAFHVSWQWGIDPSRPQQDLKTALKREGFSLVSSHPVLMRPLSIFESSSLSPKFFIRAVEKNKLSEWSLPLKEGFQATDSDVQAYREAHKRALEKQAGFFHFVGYWEGEPVSAVTLSVSAWGARLDDLATKPAFQGKGLGTEMILYGMRIAQALGCSWICLEASEKGYQLYKKLGFRELYHAEIYGLEGQLNAEGL